MSIRNYKELDETSLRAKIDEIRDSLLTAREEVMSGKEKNHNKLKVLKREVARAKTILNQTK